MSRAGSRDMSVIQRFAYWWHYRAAWWDAGPWRRAVAAEDRCFMGAPIGYPCKRAALSGGLWCRRHVPLGPDRDSR